MLARWLVPEEYGVFALAYSLFLLLGAAYNALYTEPMVVFGASQYAQRFRDYLGTLVVGHFLSVTPGAVILWIVCQSIGPYMSDSFRSTVTALVVAVPILLLQWLVRRVPYVHQRPGVSALGGAVYLILQTSALWYLHEAGRLTIPSVFASMGGASLVASCLILWRERPSFESCSQASLREVGSEHWAYGKWAIGTALLSWFPNNLYFAVLGFFGGLEATGELKALTNIFLPMNHVILALSSLLLPTLSRSYMNRNVQAFKSLTMKACGFFVGGSLINWALLSLFHRELIQVLYGDQYLTASTGLLIGSLLPLAYAVTSIFGVALKAQRRAEKVFQSYLVAGVTSILPGVILAAVYGTTGAMIAQVFAQSAGAVAVSFIYQRWKEPVTEA